MAMKERHDDTRALDVRLLCRDGAARQGRWPLASLQRLCSGLYGPLPASAKVAWSAAGLLRPVSGGEPELWLHLQARAEVPLQCQRCLQAISQPLAVDRRFCFVQGEEEAERLDEELEDDVLALPPLLDLQALLEDELILALPLVPRHDGPCPEPLPLPTEEPGFDAAAEHPFAALAALRGRKPPGGGAGSAGGA
jgi:uncharacterized protein